jgi:hypothetical protein
MIESKNLKLFFVPFKNKGYCQGMNFIGISFIKNVYILIFNLKYPYFI